jgi:hypothetical protein
MNEDVMKLRIIICFFSILVNLYIFPDKGGFNNFITRNQDRLMDGTNDFRFMSFCAPELGMQESPYWGICDPYAQEDAIKTISLLGGQVTRCYVFSIKSDAKSIAHITAPGEYNEECFKSFDNLLKLCNRYQVRLIVPFIDSWSWWGGISEFSRMRGKDRSFFFSDYQLKQDYKNLVKYVLNRKNTLTGVLYKDDPAILAWETGNELRNSSAAWTTEMSSYIKSLDPNHLIMDGRDDVHFKSSIDDPNIDIITSHYYGNDLVKRFQSDYEVLQGKKPFVVGEFGLASYDELEGLVNAIVDSKATGGLIRSLRQHDQYGGFKWHKEGDTGYYAYHFPGFAAGDTYREQSIMDLMHEAAYKIRGASLPAMLPPDSAPVLLPVKSISDIRWKGVAGASGYDIERSDSLKGQWLVIGRNIPDSIFDGDFARKMTVSDPYDGTGREIDTKIMFRDRTAVEGKTYFYRVKARNSAGESKYSNIEKAVSVRDEYGVIYDGFDDFSLMHAWTKNIVIDRDFPGLYELDQSRIKSAVNSKEFILYRTKRGINSFMITGYSENKNCILGIFGSVNGKEYRKLDSEYFYMKLEKGNNYRLNFQNNDVTSDIRYLKLQFTPDDGSKTNSLELGSVKIGYGDMKIARIEPPKTSGYEGAYSIDDFEGYKGDNTAFVKKYKINQNGGKLTLTLDRNKKENGAYGMKFDYNFSGTGYVGAIMTLKDVSWTGNDIFGFWIFPDGSRNRLVFRFRETGGEYWEYSSDSLYSNLPTHVRIKLKDFKQPGWGGKVDGVLDLSHIKEFSIYVIKGDNSASESGIIYLDDIGLMPDGK